MCTYIKDDGFACESLDFLELHETFGENGHRSDPKFQVRVLRCPDHHFDEHQLMGFAFKRGKPSQLVEDVQLEVFLCGGWDKWIKKYNLIDRFGCRLYPAAVDVATQLSLTI
jgi:hypothetical protein